MSDDFDDLATRRHAPSQLGLAPRSFTLTVQRGPDAGKQLVVDGTTPGRLLVGQSEVCALRLSDRSVSRRHCALDIEQGLLRLVDLRSTNGTLVNGVRIEAVQLRGGERVEVGGNEMLVTAGGGGGPVSRPVPSPPRPAEGPAVAGEQGFGGLLGASTAMRRLYPLCRRLAASDVPVIIEGETGTGKEVLAEALHAESARSRGPFVVFDCTTVAPSLIESALFGHERGAFTGATEARRGVFEQAQGGTLLIDEIGDLDLSLQPKLLRVLQRSEVCRVGGTRWQKVDVRVVVATRRDLDREVAAGRFRDDLFYRLHVGRVELPPLRERKGDVALLARAFWSELGGAQLPFPTDALQHWEDYAWPGNVRELYNTVARRLALGELLPAPGATSPAGPAPVVAGSRGGADYLDAVVAEGRSLPVAREQVMRELERRYVVRALADHPQGASEAAAALGIARRYFNLLRARHGL